MKVKVLYSIVVLMLANIVVNAQQYTLKNDDVVVEDGVIKSCNYDFALKNIIIPEVLDGQKVIGIENKDKFNEGVFCENGINEIILPATMKFIGKFAFSNNSITNLIIPKGVEIIGAGAFALNSLVSVKIPNSVILIGKDAFFYNKSLSDFVLPEVDYEDHVFVNWIDSEGNIYDGGNSVNVQIYEYKAQLRYTLTNDDVEVVNGILKSVSYNFVGNHIIIPGNLDGQDINTIGEGKLPGLFSDKNIVDIALPSTLNIINKGSFASNQLKKIDIPSGVYEIGESVFESNNLKNVTLPNSVVTIGSNAFNDNSELKKIELPNAVKLGFEFINWEDNKGYNYNGGSSVTDFGLSYTANFRKILFEITGKVSGTDGVTVEISGDVNESKTVDNEGDFSFTVEHGQSVKITATKNGYGFVTSEYTFNNVKENKTDLLFKVDDKLTAVNKTNNNDYLKVYPNPVIDKFTVMLNSTDRLENIQICDVNGKSLLVKRVVDNSEFIIDISDYRQGVYLLKATLKDGKISVVKIMKK